MTTGGLIAGAIMLLIVAGTILMPFLQPNRKKTQQNAEQWETFNLQYQRTLTNIHDLDEDFALGKIQKDFHESERVKLLEHGVELLKAMETLQPSQPVENHEESTGAVAFDDAIEAAIAAKRTQQQM